MPPTTPKRRWFRWSLRTILIAVTLVACWLSYATTWKKQRHAFLAQQEVIGEFNDTPPQLLNRWSNRLPVFAPGGLWLLGDRGLVSVWLPPKIWSTESQDEAASLFPEARIMKVDRGNWVSARPADSKTLPWSHWLPSDPALLALGAAGVLLAVGSVRHFRRQQPNAVV